MKFIFKVENGDEFKILSETIDTIKDNFGTCDQNTVAIVFFEQGKIVIQLNEWYPKLYNVRTIQVEIDQVTVYFVQQTREVVIRVKE